MALHHSTRADDLLQQLQRPHSANAQDGSCSSGVTHSEPEIDAENADASTIIIQPEAPLASSAQPVEIAFSASAGAFVYQMGVAAYLQEHFDLSSCHFSGCSGGAWSAALLASETDVHSAWQVIQKTQKKIVPERAAWYSGYGRYASIVAQTIQDLWKDDPDVHERVQTKKLSIAVTRFPSLQAERHTCWTDLDDLMKSILASAMIPFALSGRPCISHRGQWYVDGGITNFKGINCEQYSTWSDMYYHGVQMAVDTVKLTTTSIAERFFPSLTKPVAKLINGLLPQMESPHDAVAPRLTNGAGTANPQGVSSTDLSDATRPRIIIKPWTWRSHHLTAFHLSVDIATHQQRFDTGYEDARANHDELAALLLPKAPLAA